MNLVAYAAGLLVVVALAIQVIRAISDALGDLFGAIGQAVVLVFQVGVTFFCILMLLFLWRWLLPYFRGSYRGLRTSPASRVAFGRDEQLSRRADEGSLSGLLPVRITLQPEEEATAQKTAPPQLRKGRGNSWRHAGDWSSDDAESAGPKALPAQARGDHEDEPPANESEKSGNAAGLAGLTVGAAALGAKLWSRRSSEDDTRDTEPETAAPEADQSQEQPLPRRRIGQSGAAEASEPLRKRGSRGAKPVSTPMKDEVPGDAVSAASSVGPVADDVAETKSRDAVEPGAPQTLKSTTGETGAFRSEGAASGSAEPGKVEPGRSVFGLSGRRRTGADPAETGRAASSGRERTGEPTARSAEPEARTSQPAKTAAENVTSAEASSPGQAPGPGETGSRDSQAGRAAGRGETRADTSLFGSAAPGESGVPDSQPGRAAGRGETRADTSLFGSAAPGESGVPDSQPGRAAGRGETRADTSQFSSAAPGETDARTSQPGRAAEPGEVAARMSQSDSPEPSADDAANPQQTADPAKPVAHSTQSQASAADTTDSGAADRGAAHRAASNAVTTDPAATDPATTDPATTDPAPTDPGAAVVPRLQPTPARPNQPGSIAVPTTSSDETSDQELDREDEQAAEAPDGSLPTPVPAPVSAVRRRTGPARRPQEPYDPSKNPYLDDEDAASNELPVPRLSQLLSQSRRRVKDQARKVGRFLPGGESNDEEQKPETEARRPETPPAEREDDTAAVIGGVAAGAAAGAAAAKTAGESEESPKVGEDEAGKVRERRPSLHEVMNRSRERSAEPADDGDTAQQDSSEKVTSEPVAEPDASSAPSPSKPDQAPDESLVERPRAKSSEARWERPISGEQPVIPEEPPSSTDRPEEPAASWAVPPYSFFGKHEEEVGPDDEGVLDSTASEREEAAAAANEAGEGPDESLETAAEIAAAADLAESSVSHEPETPFVADEAAATEPAPADQEKAELSPEAPVTPRSIPGQRERVLLSGAPDLPELTPRKSPPRRAQPHQLSTYTYRNELPHLDLESRLADEAVCQAALDLANSPEDEAVRQAMLEALIGDTGANTESRTLLQVTALRGSGGSVAQFLDGLVLMRDLNARAFATAPAPVPGVISASSRTPRPIRTDNVYAVTPDRAARDLLSGVPGFTRALANWAMIADDEDRPDLEAAFQRAVANMPMELLDAIRHAIKLAPPLPGVPLRVDRLTGIVTTLPEEQATEVPGEGFPAEWRRSERRFYQ